MEKFKIQSFWSDDCTFPDPLDTGIVIEAQNIEEAVKEAKKNVKPQVKPYLEEEIEEDFAILTYFPTPSKNKTGYTETVEITKLSQKPDESELIQQKEAEAEAAFARRLI